MQMFLKLNKHWEVYTFLAKYLDDSPNSDANVRWYYYGYYPYYGGYYPFYGGRSLKERSADAKSEAQYDANAWLSHHSSAHLPSRCVIHWFANTLY